VDSLREEPADDGCFLRVTRRGDFVSNKGVALVAVLWMVAALSIMVMGLSYVLKGEARFAQQQQLRALDSAMADAAIRLSLVEINNARQHELTVPTQKIVGYMGRTFIVQLVPLNGLINLNFAPLSLLADLLVYVGKMPLTSAQVWAQAIIEHRQRTDSTGQPMRFHSPEELLKIQNFPWDAYMSIHHLMTVDLNDNVQLPNPLAAPEEVLFVLSQGRKDVVQRLLSARYTSDARNVDTTALRGDHYQVAACANLEIRAYLNSDDNRQVVRTWRVALNNPAHGLPWRVLEIKPALQASAFIQP
jgi:general secretion pathway protein K